MTANSQLLTITPKTKTKANNQNRKELQKWRSYGRLSAVEWGVGSGRGREWGKVQRLSSINGRWKIDRGRLRIV